MFIDFPKLESIVLTSSEMCSVKMSQPTAFVPLHSQDRKEHGILAIFLVQRILKRLTLGQNKKAKKSLSTKKYCIYFVQLKSFCMKGKKFGELQ